MIPIMQMLMQGKQMGAQTEGGGMGKGGSKSDEIRNMAADSYEDVSNGSGTMMEEFMQALSKQRTQSGMLGKNSKAQPLQNPNMSQGADMSRPALSPMRSQREQPGLKQLPANQMQELLRQLTGG